MKAVGMKRLLVAWSILVVASLACSTLGRARTGHHTNGFATRLQNHRTG